MSLIKKLSYHEDILREKEKVKLASGKIRERKLSLSETFGENELENWKKSHSTEISLLRDWIKKQRHLPQDVSDQDLLIFLHSCYNSLEQTKAKIDSYYTIRTHAPEIFSNRKITSKEMIQAQKVTRISPLRSATPDGYNVIFIDSVDPDAANFSFTDSMKLAGIAVDVLVKSFPQSEGTILVLDMQRSVLAHVVKTNLTILKKVMTYIQKGLPFRLKQVHVINASPLIQQIQSLIKPFIDESHSKMIHIHMQDSMHSLYKYIPQKSLPKEYGGDAESLQELNGTLNHLLRDYEPSLKEMERFVVDESKRAGKAKTSSDVFGMEGSFRRLELD